MVQATVDLAVSILCSADSPLALVVLAGVILLVFKICFQELWRLEKFAVAVGAFNGPVELS